MEGRAQMKINSPVEYSGYAFDDDEDEGVELTTQNLMLIQQITLLNQKKKKLHPKKWRKKRKRKKKWKKKSLHQLRRRLLFVAEGIQLDLVKGNRNFNGVLFKHFNADLDSSCLGLRILSVFL